ncbi:hypothetical protein E1286_19655 [Nonomuraea terrae]|uniref:Uncharacterized protein n=1 Tax=Nonomuraea terrae TaxID=2530383 RepID=A0A4R4YR87_9ACTN|nr:hypothetical protein [Nonomuraea terrae]TDD46844.1 hypothetical protein E1286_19655 [Nonomuraea terrae]
MSAVVLALGLTGVAVTPFVMQSASAAVALDPVPPCDVGEVCDIVPETTVTVTTTLGSPTVEGPEDQEHPETTITKTVTATPSSTPTKTTRSPKPTKTTSSPATPPPAITQNPQPLPTQSAEVPVVPTTPTPEQSVEMPAIAPSETIPPVVPSETQVASSEEVPLELRNAAPEYDQRAMAQQLSIPALVLVLLALFAVLIFEGRLRRMAHAAAVRKAGPQLGRPDMPPAGGYPAGPGYASAGFPSPGYPGGTAYAPIISFVPVQTYPSGQPGYGPGYPEPSAPYPPQGYGQEPPTPPEPVVLRPEEFVSTNEPPEPPGATREPDEPARERSLFEPVIAPEPLPGDIPPGGADPYEGPVPPLGPASAAEAGDAEPWMEPGSLFTPKKPVSDDPGEGYEPPPYLPPDVEATAVQPLPVTEEQPQPGGRRKGSRRKK